MIARPKLPIVTFSLIGANFFVAFLTLVSPGLLNGFGFHADRPTVQSAFTSLFLHANTIHLLGNMVFLAAVGGSVEIATGSLRFLAVYFVSGLGGILVHWLALRHAVDASPLVGASGCIAGCAGYYALRYQRLRIPIAPKVSASIMSILLFWVFLQFLGAIIKWNDAFASMSYWSHLGGFLTGAALSLAFKAPDLAQSAVDKELLDAARLHGPAQTAKVAREHLARHPRDIAAYCDLADALGDLDEPQEEITVRLKLVELCPESELIPHLLRLSELEALERINPDRRLILARSMEEESQGMAVILFESIGFGPSCVAAPEALFDLANLCKGRDEQRANKALAKLSEYKDSSPFVLAKARGWLS